MEKESERARQVSFPHSTDTPAREHVSTAPVDATIIITIFTLLALPLPLVVHPLAGSCFIFIYLFTTSPLTALPDLQ